MQLHHPGVGEGQRQRRADATGRTDRAEDAGVLVALAGRLERPRPLARPLPDEAVLLADARFVSRLRGGRLWNQISIFFLCVTPWR
jgi:hypothetical protein